MSDTSHSAGECHAQHARTGTGPWRRSRPVSCLTHLARHGFGLKGQVLLICANYKQRAASLLVASHHPSRSTTTSKIKAGHLGATQPARRALQPNDSEEAHAHDCVEGLRQQSHFHVMATEPQQNQEQHEQRREHAANADATHREAYEYWGYLLKSDKCGTPLLDSLLKGIAEVIVSCDRRRLHVFVGRGPGYMS